MAKSASTDIQPFNIGVMNVDAVIRERNLQEVTSLMIHAPSSVEFHPDGLFSEEIFGLVGSPERLRMLGYISLNTAIIAPVIYRHLLKLSNLYGEVMSGASYAVFDPETQDLKRVYGEPEDTPNAGTGYTFFMSHLPKIKFSETESAVRQNRIALIEKYQKQMFYSRLIVMPAGLRELEQDGMRMSQDDVNKLYRSILSLSLAIPPDSVSSVYDSVRYKIQSKANEIFEYIEGLVTGKRGFLQSGGYGSRNVALGTRNVITAAQYTMESPDDPKAIQPNETMTGIFQTAKGLQPLVSYHLRNIFFDPILGASGDTSRVPLISKKDLSLQYVEVSAIEKGRFVSTEGVEKWINRFRNVTARFNPITVKGEDGGEYYLCLVYDQGSRISLVRSMKDLEEHLPEGEAIDRSRLRAITWAEALYLATFGASQGKYCMVTRYPVIEDGSCYPSKIHLVSTSPSRNVTLRDLISGATMSLPEYPVLKDSTFIDSTIVHTSSLPGLGADYDGDTVSCNFLMSADANKEIDEYFKKTRAWLTPERRMILGAGSDLTKQVMATLSKDPE